LEFIEWISNLEEARRDSVIKKAGKLSKENLEIILQLNPKEREVAFELISKKSHKRKKFSEKIEDQLDAIIRNLKNKET
jgi:hypothetical protein